VPPADGALIASRFEERCYKEGDFLFQEGKICRELFFVCRGVARIISTTDKGIDRTHFFYSEDKFCTILQSFEEGIPAEASIQACCDLQVLVIGKSALLELYRQLPYSGRCSGRCSRPILSKKSTCGTLTWGLMRKSNTSSL